MSTTVEKPLKVEIERLDQVAVVRISGSASIAQSETLRRKFEKLAAEGIPVVVLDLSGLDFICSLGLGAIISLHVKSRHHAGQVRLVDPQPAVRNLLETTRLTKIFPIFPSVELAVVA